MGREGPRSLVHCRSFAPHCNAGNEIAGHTLDEYNLKGCTNQQTCANEMCQDRQNLVQHGFYPVSFAYPLGAYDANAESIVQGCGYTSGRAAGGIDVNGDGAGPVYAETLPAKDVLATRTVYDPPSSPSPGSSFPQGTKVTVSANATDRGTGSGAPSGIASVTFYLDGSTVLATDSNSPYTFSWNTSKVAKGTHTLTAVATDVAGNSVTSSAITVTIR